MKGVPLYLYLDIFTLFGPIVLSFDKKVAFYIYWKALFPAILLVGTLFIIWDIWFTEMGVWSFNPDYLVGLYVFNLPIEEILFFLVVPYACLFIYECCRAYLKNFNEQWTEKIPLLFAGLLSAVLILNWGRMYTTVTFLTTIVVLLFSYRFGEIQKNKYGYFWMAYFIHLAPFFLVNGVLTAMPIVIYNPLENMGIRIGTVPAEDSIYSLLLLLGNTLIYEQLKEKLSLSVTR